MPGFRYVVRRRYSSVTPPPLRGFVLHAIGTDDPDTPDAVHVDRFPILGIATCTETRWFKREDNFKNAIEELKPIPDSKLLDDGYHPKSEWTSVVPVILYNAFYGEPDDDHPAHGQDLVLLTETDMDMHATVVVWCTWDERDDEQRLEQEIRRLRANAGKGK